MTSTEAIRGPIRLQIDPEPECAACANTKAPAMRGPLLLECSGWGDAADLKDSTDKARSKPIVP